MDVQPAPGAVLVAIAQLQVGSGTWHRDERCKSLAHTRYIIGMDQGSKLPPQQFFHGITQHWEKRRAVIQKSTVRVQKCNALMTLFDEHPEALLARLDYLCSALTVADVYQDVHRPQEVP